VSRALKVTLPDPAAQQLEQYAETTGEPLATLAARILIQHLTSHAAPAPTRNASKPRSAQRPRWLAPAQDAAAWRSSTWAQIVALHERYPTQLAGVQDGWWEHPTQLETLAALAAWRHELDQHGTDPREELLFHAQLDDYHAVLKGQARGVAKAWHPDAPPEGWSSH
jgi:hypothetical protein